MTARPKNDPGFGTCGFRAFTYYGRPNLCAQCGTLLHEPAEEARRDVDDRFRRIWWEKARSDSLFLFGLLAGGPLMAIGSTFRIGLFIALAGALSSVVRRYSNFSTAGTLVVGSVLSLIAATLFVDTPVTEEEALAAELARAAYVQGLSDLDPDVLVETRGIGHVAVWFNVPPEFEGECGEYPSESVREHLAGLGFLRVVVAVRNQGGGLCSFRP
jgi:hypothetical protein